jgi:hypothetical protein
MQIKINPSFTKHFKYNIGIIRNFRKTGEVTRRPVKILARISEYLIIFILIIIAQ